jgi:peroxiredoxin
MRPDIVPGAAFPDYELSDHRGKHRTLSELQGGNPLVLVLSRGGFCPKDRRQHEGSCNYTARCRWATAVS